MSGKALAVGSSTAGPSASANAKPKTPAASALPLTEQPPRELAEIDAELLSRKALAAGSSGYATDRIVAMIGEFSQ